MTHGQVQQLFLVAMVLVSLFYCVPRLLLDFTWVGCWGELKVDIHIRGAQILWARLSWSLDYVWWWLMFVGCQYETCFM
jgi:hypothetical protein